MKKDIDKIMSSTLSTYFIILGVVGSVAVGTVGMLLTVMLELPLQHTQMSFVIPMLA